MTRRKKEKIMADETVTTPAPKTPAADKTPACPCANGYCQNCGSFTDPQ